MTSKKKKHTKSATHQHKREAVMGGAKKKGFPMIMTVGIVVLAVAAFLGYQYFPQGAEPDTATAVAVSQASSGTEVRYPVSRFDDGQAHHFEYTANDMTIRYFILKSSDGVIRAAFDACDVCWPSNKGYYQEGDFMVCRNCGRRFASVKINEVKGGCNPAPLERRIDGDELVLTVNDILKGSQYFNFKG